MFQFCKIGHRRRHDTLVHVITYQYCSTSIGRISEWEGLRSRRRGGWAWGGDVALRTGEGAVLPPQKKNCIFGIKITRLRCTLTPFWSTGTFIRPTGWKWTTMHRMVHFAMLQTTKYCSRIQVKTHSTMLAINFLCKQTTHMGDLHTADRKLCWQILPELIVNTF